MVLAGQKPDTILDVCSRAMAFWSYQVAQEAAYKDFVMEKTKARSQQVVNELEGLVDKLNKECQSLKTELEGCLREKKTLCERLGELNEMHLEKGRQYQKLYAQFQQLKRRSIPVLETPHHSASPRLPPTLVAASARDVLGHPSEIKIPSHSPQLLGRSGFFLQPRPCAPFNKDRSTPLQHLQ
ncbi:E3 ubiquitin-protein ligase CCNB1IP1-like [Ornithodoros turicata]|uniref:E3 ubiquitin-protein ligase CCNB1IP1-like n=1 Tax=Ornithodoros turicata TaxID=34597 RepID=UPI003139740A